MTISKVLLFDFICYNKTEQFLLRGSNNSCPVGSINDVKPLGTAFCSLINSIDDIIIFKNNIITNIHNYIQYESVEENLNFIFNEFISINEYFILTQCRFNFYYKLILEDLKNNKTDENIINIYKHHIEDFFNYIIADTNRNKELFSYNNFGYYSPDSLMILNKDKKSTKYVYTIQEKFDLVFSASFYQIFLNKIHLKKCIYTNCDKLFATPYGQTRYCENPCPDNPNRTCRTISKKFNRKEDIQSPIEKEVDCLGEQLKRLREQYRYYAKIQTQKRKKEMIINNAETLKNISADLRRKIKGNSSECQAKYLKIYKDFINEVESNLKSSPKVFKIKKPKY